MNKIVNRILLEAFQSSWLAQVYKDNSSDNLFKSAWKDFSDIIDVNKIRNDVFSVSETLPKKLGGYSLVVFRPLDRKKKWSIIFPDMVIEHPSYEVTPMVDWNFNVLDRVGQKGYEFLYVKDVRKKLPMRAEVQKGRSERKQGVVAWEQPEALVLKNRKRYYTMLSWKTASEELKALLEIFVDAVEEVVKKLKKHLRYGKIEKSTIVPFLGDMRYSDEHQVTWESFVDWVEKIWEEFDDLAKWYRDWQKVGGKGEEYDRWKEKVRDLNDKIRNFKGFGSIGW